MSPNDWDAGSGPEPTAARIRFRRFGWRLWVHALGRWWGIP